MNKFKIAIYSGVVPSTTFIERLVHGMAQSDATIYLFGNKIKKINYIKKNIIISTFSGKVNKFFRVIRFSLLLFLFKNKDKKKLDKWIFSRKCNYTMLKIKCYPVLWYHPDVFHLQWAKSIEDWIWVQEFGMKLIVSLRGSQLNVVPVVDKTTVNMYKRHFPQVNGFHAVSKAIAKQAEKYGADPAKIKVVYSGLTKFDNFENSSCLIPGQEPLQILSVGRAHWIKGYNYALDAFALLQKQGFNFKYTIIGAKDFEELEFQKNDLGLNESVTFIQHVTHDKVIELMQQSHLILLPSVEEGIANVVLEAMALQKIVLTTNCGGMEEIVTDGLNGFVVPIRDPEAIAQKIREIRALSKSQLEEIAFNARQTVEAIHSEEQMVNDMSILYNFVLEKGVLR